MDGQKLYKEFTDYIGTTDFAISPETCNYLYRFVKEHKIKSVLDMGSGLSTVVFLLAGCDVLSLDTNKEYISKFEGFLDSMNLKADIKSFETYKGRKKFDLVFYDLGDFETRLQNITKPIHHAKGYVIYDDLDNSDYTEALEIANINYSIIPSTLDSRGRVIGLVAI